jgi:hypothetical protein
MIGGGNSGRSPQTPKPNDEYQDCLSKCRTDSGIRNGVGAVVGLLPAAGPGLVVAAVDIATGGVNVTGGLAGGRWTGGASGSNPFGDAISGTNLGLSGFYAVGKNIYTGAVRGGGYGANGMTKMFLRAGPGSIPLLGKVLKGVPFVGVAVSIYSFSKDQKTYEEKCKK